MFVLDFNPMEKYSGREAFKREIMSFADKFWMPNPLDNPDWILADILYEPHRRGITKAREELGERSKLFREMEARLVSLKEQIPDSPCEADFLAQLTELAQQTELNIRDYRPGSRFK